MGKRRYFFLETPNGSHRQDRDEERSAALKSLLQTCGFEQQSTGPTHDSNRAIDQIRVKSIDRFNLQSGTTESYYSDHKPFALD